MGDDAGLTINDILASLERRGFYGGAIDRNRAGEQVYAVIEELGEVARLLRRHAQGVAELQNTKLSVECCDVVIAAVCLLGQVAGITASGLLRGKLAMDEQRGYLHNGGGDGA